MREIVLIQPQFNNVREEWQPILIDKCDYSEKDLYQSESWLKRYNRWANKNLFDYKDMYIRVIENGKIITA